MKGLACALQLLPLSSFDLELRRRRGSPLDVAAAWLYLPLNEPLPPVDTASHLGEIREMMRKGEYQRAADFVVELSRMLADSRPGWLELLPALPRQWPSGRIEGLRCRGTVAMPVLAWDGERVDVTLRSASAQELELRIPGGIDSIDVRAGRATVSGEATAAGGHLDRGFRRRRVFSSAAGCA